MTMNSIAHTGLTGVAPLDAQAVTESNRSISDIILALGITSLMQCENKMNDFYKIVEKNNDNTKFINEMKTKLETVDIKDLSKEEKAKIAELCRYASAEQLPVKGQVLEALKNASDAIGSVNTLDMTRLQSSINKMNEMSQLVSNNLSKFNQMSMAIIGNMR